MTPERGYLVKVDFIEDAYASPYQFATIDKQDCIEKINAILNTNFRVNTALPNWAYYDYSIQKIKELIHTLFKKTTSEKMIIESEKNNEMIDRSLFSPGVNAFFKFYEIKNLQELILKSNEGIFKQQMDQAQKEILKKLHNEIFNAMASYQKKTDKKQKIDEKVLF